MERWSALWGRQPPGRLIVSILASMCLAAAVSSCGVSAASSEEAEALAVRWLKAMAASNVKSACVLMDAENHSPYPEHPDWSRAKDCQEMWLHSDNTPVNWKPKPNAVSIWGNDHPKVLRVGIDGDRATVIVEGAGLRLGRPVWLRRENGRWRVDGAEYPI